jgi:hypothetical protein
MNIEQYKKLQMEVARKAHDLEMAESALQNAEQDLRSQVVVSKVGKTVTLEFGGRVLKCVKNSHNRYNIKENNKVIISDYIGGGIHDIRLQLALGEIIKF